MRTLPASLALAQEPKPSSSSQRMHSALMNPRWKSVWMTPAHSGALAPARNVQARDSLSPVVRKVRRRGRGALADAHGLQHLGPVLRRQASGLGLHLHADGKDLDGGGGGR